MKYFFMEVPVPRQESVWSLIFMLAYRFFLMLIFDFGIVPLVWHYYIFQSIIIKVKI